MLSDQEKNRILLEEQYRNEVALKLKTKSKIDLVETIIKILQGLAIIAGIWATYSAYKKQNEEMRARELEQTRQTAREFKKSFYEKQLEYYSEAAETTAILATANKESEDYAKARKNFYTLYWGKLSMVEDKTVEKRMVQFDDLLKEYEQVKSEAAQEELKDSLKQASLRLAHDAFIYTINVWLDSTERKNYNR